MQAGSDEREHRPHVERAQRYTLLLRAAKLIAPDRECLCILRDVSATGLKLRLFHPLPDADELAIELGNGQTYAILPVWQSGGHAGFRFAAGPVDIAPMLQGAGPFPRRAVRLRAQRAAQVVTPAGSHPVLLRDISLDGAGIDSERGFAIGERLRLEIAGFPKIAAKVRWRRGTSHGLALERHFALDELARLLAGAASDTAPGKARKMEAC